MRHPSAQLIRTFLLSLLALGAVLPVQAGASGTRPGHLHGARVGVHVGAVRYGGSYRHHPYYAGHRRSYYRYYGYPYSPGYPWGWGGFWLGPPPRKAYVFSRSIPGIVETDVRPKKAEVKLDGVVVGQSRDYNGKWDRLALPAGRHTIEFAAPGYMTLEMQIDLEAGGYARFDQKLQKGEGRDPRSTELSPESAEDPPPSTAESFPVLPSGFLRIRATPADAVIYLDGEFLARADELSRLHGALPVAPGRHLLELVRPGYGSRRVEVDIESDRRSTVDVELESE